MKTNKPRKPRAWNSTLPARTAPIPRSRLQPRRKPVAARKPVQRASSRNAGRWDAWRAHEREYIHANRVWCEYPGCQRTGVQVHHPYGRHYEPWGSSRLVCVFVCFPHHESVHRPWPNAPFRNDRDVFRRVALARFQHWLTIELPKHSAAGAPPWPLIPYVDQDLRAHLVYLTEVARANDIVPPDWQEAA